MRSSSKEPKIEAGPQVSVDTPSDILKTRLPSYILFPRSK